MNRIIPITMGAALILITACKELKELPVASFTLNPATAGVGDTIYFQNTSEGANTFDWDFGDGNVSTEENPSHIYTAEGMFTILLVATNADGSDEASGGIWITLWTTRAPMPTGRWELSTCVVDGKIYAIGGAGPVYQALRTVEEYNPATDTWTTKSKMLTARQGLSTNMVNGKIYAIGGGSSPSDAYGYSTETFSTVEEYDPATNTWTTKSEMPTARGWHSANVLDGKIYVIGGSSVTPSAGTPILAVEVYDPAKDTWTQKGNIPRRIGAGFTSEVEGKIYAFGGYGGLEKVHEYDPETDTWIQKADMPTRRCGLSTSVLDGKIYAIGGHSGSSPHLALATVEVYNPATDTWTTTTNMLTERCGVRTSVVNGKIYAIGGYMGTWIGQMCVTVEVYYK